MSLLLIPTINFSRLTVPEPFNHHEQHLFLHLLLQIKRVTSK